MVLYIADEPLRLSINAKINKLNGGRGHERKKHNVHWS